MDYSPGQTLTAPSLVDPENQNNLISRLATQRMLTVGGEWSQDVHRMGNQSELRYSYHVVCHENYYDETCSTFCKPRNDSFGHYSCDDKGSRHCLEGWSGEYCTHRECLIYSPSYYHCGTLMLGIWIKH